VVDEPDLLGPHRVEPGDVIVALGSSGLHSNGYSLARDVFFTRAGWDVHRHVAALGRTLGEELLEPTRIYARDCLTLANELDVHAIAHITAVAGNVRALPEHLDALPTDRPGARNRSSI
jgi:phosphoribosylformylglycinamidine cyclo-ligase